jgi:WD40 repeat protein
MIDLSPGPRISAYSAFISYKHAVDSKFAASFELDLKRYARGVLSRPRRIFRDEQHIKVGDDLPSIIREALVKSEFLILLASPAAAKSPWVRQEIEIWCGELKRTERLIIVLTSGKIAIAESGSEIDWANTDALPKELRQYLRGFPLWNDLSGTVTSEARVLSNPLYKACVNTVVAKLDGVDPNILDGREWRLRRRNIRIAWGLVALLATLLGAAIFSATRLHLVNLDLEEALRISKARELGATARLQPIPEALLTAAAAVESAEVDDSVRSLLDVMSTNKPLYAHLTKADQHISFLKMSDDGQRVFFGSDRSGGIQVLDTSSGKVESLQLPGDEEVENITFVNDQLFALTQTGVWKIGYPLGPSVKITDVDPSTPGTGKFAVLNGGNCILIGFANGEVRKIDIGKDSNVKGTSLDGMISGLVANDDFIACSAMAKKSAVSVLSIKDGSWKNLETHFSVNAVTISKAGDRLGVAFEDGVVGVWKLPSLEADWTAKIERSAYGVEFSPDGQCLAAANNDGEVTIFSTYGDVVDFFQAGRGGIWCLKWNGDLLLTAGSDGWIRAWKPETPGPFAEQLSTAKFICNDKSGSFHAITSEGGWRMGRNGAEKFSHDFGSIIRGTGETLISEVDSRLFAHCRKSDGSYSAHPYPDPPEGMYHSEVAVAHDGSWVSIGWHPRDWSTGQARLCLWQPASGKLYWLSNVPRTIAALAFKDNSELAIADNMGELVIWDVSTRKLKWSTPYSTNLREITNILWGEDDRLYFGGLSGFVECRMASALSVVLARTERVSGSVLDIKFISMESMVVLDTDGIQWFDRNLQFLGKLLDTTNRQLSVDEVALLDPERKIATKMRNGTVLQIDIDPRSWREEAIRRAGSRPLVFDGDPTDRH